MNQYSASAALITNPLIRGRLVIRYPVPSSSSTEKSSSIVRGHSTLKCHSLIAYIRIRPYKIEWVISGKLYLTTHSFIYTKIKRCHSSWQCQIYDNPHTLLICAVMQDGNKKKSGISCDLRRGSHVPSHCELSKRPENV